MSSNNGERLERRTTLRVLVVDDTPEIRFLLEVSLSREAKCRLVGEAEDGRQALEKIELLRPDLVVMDLQMPVMDGITATREILARWPHLEIVGFTSTRRPGEPDALREAGAVDGFEKTDIKSLMDFIRGRASKRGAA